VKGHIRDAATGEPLPNTVLHVKNITAGRNDDILHDVTSGEFGHLNITKQKTKKVKGTNMLNGVF
jgi:hypothetical protein